MQLQVCSLCSLFVLSSFSWQVKASNILFLHLGASASHRNSIWPLAEKLADKGHNVTYFISLPKEKRMGSHPKVEELSSQSMVVYAKSTFDDFDINLKLNNSLGDVFTQVIEFSLNLCAAFYTSPEIKQWLSRPGLHFDLVLLDASLSECFYPLIDKFKAKHILFAPAFMPSLLDTFGLVPESASIPVTVSTFFTRPAKPTEMNLFARVCTTLDYIFWYLGHLYYLNQLENLFKNRLNFSDFKPLLEMQQETSLVLLNGHFVEEYPMSLPPIFQSYSGLSCSKDKIKERMALPSNLATFVEGNNTDGFIYISFGTVIHVALMPVDVRNKFFEAFDAFPKLRFLWRWTGEVPKYKPANLMFQRWFPQQDLLKHTKIKAFVTQTGRPSSQEALCYGVPIIAMPIWADQDYNSDRLEYVGAAINLDISKLSAEELVQAIREIAYTDKYKMRVSELSGMYRDRPIDPLENALYWTEYVLRHNTSILKPLAMGQPWYQRKLLDVYLLLTLVLIAVFLLIGGLLRYFVKSIFSLFRNETNVRQKVKQE